MYFVGIDCGSVATKAVLLDEKRKICGSASVRTGATLRKAYEYVFDKVCEEATVKKNDIKRIIATGYGRKKVALADDRVTEITAHAHGARQLYPQVSLIIDIGGQDTKAIILNKQGVVKDFVMNDKCAAGTGRFLEVMAHILDVPIEGFGSFALTFGQKLTINSTCTVFAESEVISLISREHAREDIAYAIHESVINRIIALVKKLRFHEDVFLSGGVSYNIAIQHLLEQRLKRSVFVPKNPQIIGALGAALIALIQVESQ